MDLSQNQFEDHSNTPSPPCFPFLSCISTVKKEGMPLSLVAVTVRASWIKMQAYLKNISKRASAWPIQPFKFIFIHEIGDSAKSKIEKKKRGVVSRSGDFHLFYFLFFSIIILFYFFNHILFNIQKEIKLKLGKRQSSVLRRPLTLPF